MMSNTQSSNQTYESLAKVGYSAAQAAIIINEFGNSLPEISVKDQTAKKGEDCE